MYVLFGVTGLISDGRQPASIEKLLYIARTRLSSLSRFCGHEISLKLWKQCGSMEELKDNSDAQKLFNAWSEAAQLNEDNQDALGYS